jgi:hypothetical protein
MKKLIITLVFTLIIAGTSASAMTFKIGDDTVDLYSSIRAYTVFTHTDPGDFSICTRPAGKSCSQFAIGLQDNSRAGLRWTKGNFFLNNEWGITNVDNGNAQLRLRFLYGDYKFAGGENGRIRIGQLPGIVHTSANYDVKFSADNGLQGYGTIADVRRIGINYEIGGFSVAAISMRQEFNDSSRISSIINADNFMEIMPRIEAAYCISSVKIAGTFVTSSARGGDDNLNHVNAGHIMFVADPKLSDKVKLIASGFYSVNGGVYNMVTVGGGYSKSEAVNRDNYRAIPYQKTGTDKVEFDNTSVYGGALAFVVDKFEAGFGIQSAGNDQWDDNQTSMGLYANYKFRVSNLRITPEIGYLHSGDRTRSGKTMDEGKNYPKDARGFRFGVQFRFDV